MKHLKIFSIIIIFFLSGFTQNYNKLSKEKKTYAIVIHGGAGNITKMTEEYEKAYYDKLNEALILGDSILKNGGTAVDAVEQIIMVLENSPLFNAGKGAVFSNRGICELDASIMNGENLTAGAVAGVTDIKNPIKAARFVMEKSQHVMLTGSGASEFAKLNGLEIVPNEYFQTEKRKKSWEKAVENEADAHGTVGCVVLDTYGNLAAGTSTGGLTNKKYGRVGDSPIIGAGTYADNSSCAVSCTGTGEFFIRLAVAHEVSALIKYKKLSLQEAADFVIHNELEKLKGDGGLIAVDNKGNIAFSFNTEGMFRGYLKSDGKKEILFYK